MTALFVIRDLVFAAIDFERRRVQHVLVLLNCRVEFVNPLLQLILPGLLRLNLVRVPALRRHQLFELLADALGHLECRVVARHEAGDHTLVIGEVERATARDARPLLYYRGGYAQLER